jgi:threonine dehydrogenase-like Zn-dependent dehydrogenase
MKAVVIERPGVLVVKDIPMPEVGEKDILVKVGSASICNATDNHILEGTFEGYHDHYPQILGHEVSGAVVATGGSVRGVKLGERLVFYTPHGAFCEYTKVDADGAWARVPDGVSDEEAPLCEMLHGSLIGTVYPAGLRDGEKVVIVGQGPMGLVALQCVKAMADVTVGVVDQIPLRLARAVELGADHKYDCGQHTSTQVAAQIAQDMGAIDLAILCTAVDQSKAQDLLDFAVRILKRGGRLTGLGVEVKGLSHYVNIREIFGKRIHLARSLAPQVYSQGSASEGTKERQVFQMGVDWVRDGVVNVKSLLTHTVTLDNVIEGLRLCRERPDIAIKVLVKVGS